MLIRLVVTGKAQDFIFRLPKIIIEIITTEDAGRIEALGLDPNADLRADTMLIMQTQSNEPLNSLIIQPTLLSTLIFSSLQMKRVTDYTLR